MSFVDGTAAAPPLLSNGSGATPGPVTGWVSGLEPLRPELLRPRSVPELVDEGFGALRRHPGLLVGSGLLFLLPTMLITALLGEGQATPGLVTGGTWWAGAVSIAGFSLSAAMVGLPLARAVALEAAGIRPTWRRCHALGWRIWFGALLTWALLAPLRLLGMLPVVTVVLASAFTLQLSAVQSLEGAGPWRATRRMMQLGLRRFGRSLGVVCLQLTVGMMVSVTLGLIPLIVILRLPTAWQRPGANLVQLGLGLLLCPAAAWTAAAFHLDQRIRGDGLDLEVRLEWWSAAANAVTLPAEPVDPRRYTPLRVSSRRRGDGGARHRAHRWDRVGRGQH